MCMGDFKEDHLHSKSKFCPSLYLASVSSLLPRWLNVSSARFDSGNFRDNCQNLPKNCLICSFFTGLPLFPRNVASDLKSARGSSHLLQRSTFLRRAPSWASTEAKTSTAGYQIRDLVGMDWGERPDMQGRMFQRVRGVGLGGERKPHCMKMHNFSNVLNS